MSYVPPHARKNVLNKNNNTNSKNKGEPLNTFEKDFPTLVKPVQPIKSAMNFSNLFNEEEILPKEIKQEMKKGFVKLTKNGMIDSISEEEKIIEDEKKNIKEINSNMTKLYNHIENTKQKRLAWDNNYVPEEVIDEYSSSDHYTSEESDEYAEDPEDDFYEL